MDLIWKFLLDKQFVIVINSALQVCPYELNYFNVIFKRGFIGIAFWRVVVQYMLEPRILKNYYYRTVSKF